MKKVILTTIIILILSSFIHAQLSSLDSFFKQYKEQKDFTYVYAGKTLINFALPRDFTKEFATIKFIKVLVYENENEMKAKSFKSELKEIMKSNDFELILEVKDDEELVATYLKESKDKKENTNMLVLIEDGSDVTVVWINGILNENIKENNKNISTNKNILNKEILLSNFSRIEVASPLNVYLIQSNSEKVVIEADENIIKYIDISVKDEKLIVKIKEGTKNILNNVTIKIYVYFKDLTEIEQLETCNITSNNQLIFNNLKIFIRAASSLHLSLKCKKLDVLTTGASSVNLSLNCEDLKITQIGATSIDISGNTNTMLLSCNSASNFKGKKLIAVNCKANISGSSNAAVTVINNLELKVSNASSAKYYGNPKQKTLTHDISSSIKNLF